MIEILHLVLSLCKASIWVTSIIIWVGLLMVPIGETLEKFVFLSSCLPKESGLSEDVVTHLIEESFILHGVVDIGDYIPWLKRFDLQGSVKAMKKVTEKLDLYMQRIVEQHREKRIEVGSETEDFIDVLISQSEENGEAIHDKDAFIKATAVVSASSDFDCLL